MGNLTRSPELRYTPGGAAVCEIGVAMNRTWNNQAGEKQEETTFVDCTAWGKTAETINQYLDKGKPIFIEGRLQLDSWENQAGEKRTKMRVVIERFQFIGSPDSGGQQGGGGGQQGGGYQQQGGQQQQGGGQQRQPSGGTQRGGGGGGGTVRQQGEGTVRGGTPPQATPQTPPPQQPQRQPQQPPTQVPPPVDTRKDDTLNLDDIPF